MIKECKKCGFKVDISKTKRCPRCNSLVDVPKKCSECKGCSIYGGKKEKCF
ncbi:hypothetical protein SAMN02745883_00303 [Caminicella sporogenes DSM 14501]|uniref:Uncharacterized protein n=1 Tax=Caminicella sporogenes DSM 14501 TaxID=1121266 RepID=A0A1M6LQF6_9FIRM|nr:hypothetical protein [Caminicella sporogenes]WIF94497.1 hypothetical protein QNI18_09530 [Caminicella sporogenes]SHJ73427.1 hypothetical protein SAMN02745883_00303 [Caminicella sporogenes DSM 14501]